MVDYRDLDNQPERNQMAPDAPPVQFLLGEAMVSQKKQRKHASDLVKIKELMAEIQIYVQKHHVAITQEMVDDTKLKVTIESLRNEMEIRYELALKQFYDKLKIQLTNFVDKEDLNNRLYEKLHKREFDKHFDRLNSTCSYLDTRVTNAIPAMKYDLDTRLKGKAEQRDLNAIEKDKASVAFVAEVVKRLNKLEEKVSRKRGGDSSSDGSRSGSRRSGSHNHISEEDEDESDDEARRQRKNRKEKILKGSASMGDIKEKKLDQIEEEKEASIKSGGTGPKNLEPATNNSDGKSKQSSPSRSRKYNLDAPVGGGAPVSKEFEQEMTSKFEDVYASLETNKETIDSLKSEIAGVRNDMLAKQTGAAMASPTGPTNTKNDKATAAATEALQKKIKEIEQSIASMNNKFQSELDRMQLMQPVGGSGDADAAGASARLMDMTVRKIEAKHQEHSKRMGQIDIKVQNALTDIQGLNEHFKNKQDQIFKNITRVGNLRNEVTNKIDAFQNTLQVLHDNFNDMTHKNQKDLADMKLIINEEMKDMRAANQTFIYEIERNQNLFRSLHQELVITMDEKKKQNEALMDNAREATIAEKKNRRAGSVSIMNAHDKLSFQTLLPQLRVATDTSNTKLTQRQVRIAQLVKGDNFGMSGSLGASGLLNDPSSLSIKTKLGMNDGIRSTRAFMTSVTPGRDEPNLGFASDNNNSPKEANSTKAGGRKVFGAKAYLDRQAKLGLTRNSSPPPQNPPLQKSEFDNEFNALHSNMAESIKK